MAQPERKVFNLTQRKAAAASGDAPKTKPKTSKPKTKPKATDEGS
jgi:hypothetical protein